MDRKTQPNEFSCQYFFFQQDSLQASVFCFIKFKLKSAANFAIIFGIRHQIRECITATKFSNWEIWFSVSVIIMILKFLSWLPHRILLGEQSQQTAVNISMKTTLIFDNISSVRRHHTLFSRILNFREIAQCVYYLDFKVKEIT